MNRAKWIWMPHAGHLIVGNDCRFHLNTYVGKYLVSTVGEWLPDSNVREILAASRGKPLEGMGDYRRNDWMKKFGFEEIGHGRTIETMVFQAHRATKNEDKCCPWVMGGSELDFAGYNSRQEAFEGHYKMCLKWSKKK